MSALRPVNGILHLYHRPTASFGPDASTVMEHVESLRRYSRFRVWQVNTHLGMPEQLRELRFAVVVLHYSLFGLARYHLDDDFRRYLADACDQSYKIAFFQDEHQFCAGRFAFLDEFAIDCVYSCLEPEHLEAVYGAKTSVPTHFSVLPGYVSEELLAAARRFRVPDERRSVDIGYRGRLLPPYCGRSGLEKYEIGVRFKERAQSLDLRLDIACGEGDRIYGDDWYRFVAGCRAVLGTESGVDVFDVEGEVHAAYERLREGGREVTVEELERGALGRWEGRIPYRTISPRHFEAAALGVCQILYEGRYSDAMQPMEHYIPLKKDFSNFDQVIELFRNRELRDEIARKAESDLIESGAFTYERFVAGFDERLLAAGADPEVSPAEARRVDSALRRGSLRRRARAGFWDLTDRVRVSEFPGRRLLRGVGRPALNRLDRLRERSEA
jgi:hypothetical protein